MTPWASHFVPLCFCLQQTSVEASNFRNNEMLIAVLIYFLIQCFIFSDTSLCIFLVIMTHNLTHLRFYMEEKMMRICGRKKYLPNSDIIHSFHLSKLFSSTLLCAVSFKSSLVTLWFSISQLQNILHADKNDKAVYRFNVHFKSECEVMKSHRFVGTI